MVLFGTEKMRACSSLRNRQIHNESRHEIYNNVKFDMSTLRRACVASF